jgi:hypothetical protein
LGENWLRDSFRHDLRACSAQLAPPGVDQRRREIVAPTNLGNALPRRKRLGQDLQPFLIAPSRLFI